MNKDKYKYLRRIPANYHFWLFVLANEKDMKAFLERGNKRQLSSLKSALKYLKRQNKEKYLELNGKDKEEKVKDAYTKFER